MRTPIQQLAPSFTSARAYRDWKNAPQLLTAEEVVATVLAAPDPYQCHEKNIKGYAVTVEIDEDCGDIVSQCWVSLKFTNRPGQEWCSSLALIEGEGIIEYCGYDDIADRPVADATVAAISDWAQSVGY
jgi:hypothetical protein